MAPEGGNRAGPVAHLSSSRKLRNRIWQLCLTCTALHLLSATCVGSEFTTHPMLFYSPDRVPNMIKQARTTHTAVSGILVEAARTMLSNQQHYLPSSDYEKFGSRWNEVYGNNLGALAMYCVLYPEDHEARSFAFKFMDTMVALPRWQVKDSPNDEVPVAHSLTGFVTAFDFLYPVMGNQRRDLYLKRIVTVTKEFYDASLVRSWGYQYLQNHVATNYVALLHGSLVASVHRVEGAEMWIQHVKETFGKTMLLLDHITDGSLDEGVAYGSYTSRSITQYIYLALRHLNIDHTQDLWLKEHFWFYYNTVLPKFQRTIGIADSNSNWFYGPESQLVFLETFVMRNGHGNWLAQEIRNHRVMDKKSRLAPSESQRWCTLHTEFLWYDSTIRPKAPSQSGTPDLHVFSDWGVVTYSRVSSSYPQDTFLAFKCGKMHGQGIFDIVKRDMYSSWVNKWKSFNPGHEHPDQNMFVFAPNGQQFISDGLYGPKYSYLNNVLLFSPSPTSKCFQPWEGQLGECRKWLSWGNPEVAQNGGELISASLSDGMVHISGEARDGYNSRMQLTSIYRSLVLLNPNLLVVLDHIQKRSKSPLTHASAFFHNIDNVFEQARLGKLYGAKATIQGEPYTMFWVTPEGRSPKAYTTKQSHPSEYRVRETNFVNITMKLRPRQTRMAYAFSGPAEKIIAMSFLEATESGVSFEIETDKETYTIKTVTKHNDPVARQQFLGYPGYVSVRKGASLIKFGINSTLQADKKQSHPKSDRYTSMSLFLGAVALGLVVLYLVRRRFRRNIPRCGRLVLGIALVSCFTIVSWQMDDCQNDSCPSSVSPSHAGSVPSTSQLPSVVITSLPASGSEILGWLFYYNPDFLHMKVPSDLVILPAKEQIALNPFVDACTWMEKDKKRLPTLASTMKMLRWDRQSLLMGEGVSSQHQEKLKSKKKKEEVNFKTYQTQDLLRHDSMFPNAQTVLHFTSGSWGLKLQWLQGILGDTIRSIHVVRDPRAWVANFLQNNMQLYTSMNVAQHVQMLAQQLQNPCQLKGLDSATFYRHESTPHKLLASVWAAYTEQVLSSLKGLGGRYRVVRYEDLVRSPRSMADNIYQFIGFPLPPSMEQQLIQAAHSGIYQSPHEGVVRPSKLDNWKKELTLAQIRDIESLCAKGMRLLNYSAMEAETQVTK